MPCRSVGAFFDITLQPHLKTTMITAFNTNAVSLPKRTNTIIVLASAGGRLFNVMHLSPNNQFRTKKSCDRTCCLVKVHKIKSSYLLIMAAESNEKSVKKADVAVLPHLESWERMMKLPVCEAAWTQGVGVYDKMRGESRKCR